MSSFLGSYNLSVLSIPAYYILALIPHAYAVAVASDGDSKKNWDNRNPRSSELKTKLKDRLPADVFAKYERAEACHANGMENLPLFATTVILGNVAGLKEETMTKFAAYYLAVRVIYTGVYLTNFTRKRAAVRSLLWVASVALCLKTMVQAAKAIGK